MSVSEMSRYFIDGVVSKGRLSASGITLGWYLLWEHSYRGTYSSYYRRRRYVFTFLFICLSARVCCLCLSVKTVNEKVVHEL